MKTLLGSMLFVVSFGAGAATAERVQFTGFVVRDASPPVHFDLHVPARQHVGLMLSDGSTLTISAPGGVPGETNAQARLVSATGEVLHTATIADTAVASTSLAYRVCDNEAVYMSPAPADAEACPSP